MPHSLTAAFSKTANLQRLRQPDVFVKIFQCLQGLGLIKLLVLISARRKG
jgi:hypothetical protein